MAVNVLRTAKEERNILHTIKRRGDDWIDHSLRRNYLLKCIIEGMIEGKYRSDKKKREKT